MVLYERDEVSELRDLITMKIQQQKPIDDLQICGGYRFYGQPGCGKSLSTFACVVQLSDEKKKSLLWVHYEFKDDDRATALRIYYDERGEKRVERGTIYDGVQGLESALGFFKSAMSDRQYDILVVDGCGAGVHEKHKTAAYRYARTGALVGPVYTKSTRPRRAGTLGRARWSSSLARRK